MIRTSFFITSNSLLPFTPSIFFLNLKIVCALCRVELWHPIGGAATASVGANRVRKAVRPITSRGGRRRDHPVNLSLWRSKNNSADDKNFYSTDDKKEIFFTSYLCKHIVGLLLTTELFLWNRWRLLLGQSKNLRGPGYSFVWGPPVQLILIFFPGK